MQGLGSTGSFRFGIFFSKRQNFQVLSLLDERFIVQIKFDYKTDVLSQSNIKKRQRIINPA